MRFTISAACARFTTSAACAALFFTVAASSAFAVAPALATAQSEQATYAIAGTGGVTIRNIRDNAGIPVAQCPAGTVLCVHERMGTWTQVEPAGGLTCWVLGAYLTDTETSGRYLVNKNGVNMRPLPSTTTDSFPLKQHLYVGDIVRMVGRSEPSLPFERDWIQIHSPQGVYGWTLTSALQPAVDAAQARATWNANWDAIMEVMSAPTATPVETKPEAPKSATEETLVRAHRLMNESPPRYDEARALFKTVLSTTAPSSAIARAARNGMNQADAYASIEALQRQLELERVAREQARLDREADLARRRSENTPLMGRYDGRGWVVERKLRNGEKGWFLKFAGKDNCIVQCSSGRYDLGMFEGYEVGVIGRMMNEAGAAQATCDVRAIEVLSARSR
jgi:hypothetical protein